MLRSKKFWVAITAIAVTGAILFFISRPLFFRVIAIIGIVMLISSALIMVLTFRKARRVSILALLISITVSLVSFLVYQAILPVKAHGLVMFVAMLAGCLLGTAWAQTPELFIEKGAVKMRGNLWYLAVWALIFSITQITALVAGRPPRLALLLLCLGTGLALGNGGSMALRAWRANQTAKS